MPSIGEGDVLLKVNACGVCGTDVRKVAYNLVKPPTVLGHEVAGVVTEVGKKVVKFKPGDRVVVAHHTPCYVCHYCRHGSFSMCRLFKTSNLDPGGFAEFIRIPAGHVEETAFKIPDNLSDEEAIFMEPLACVVRNLKRTSILSGDTVMVVGLGSMGLLTGQLVQKRYRAKVIATDLKEDRIALGKKLGFEQVYDAKSPYLQKQIDLATDKRGVDLLVLTAGNPVSYSESLQYVRDGGVLNIFAGLTPGSHVTFDVNELYSREITVYSSYSPAPADLQDALELLASKTIDTKILSPSNYRLDQVSEAIQAVQTQKVLKAIIYPQTGVA